ncbi:MAG TPA: hypothetical protein VJ063_00540 [Verrucomicrobiae bacterium]|nr:hypothetical protein [Verrucomicrobiae bacterium]
MGAKKFLFGSVLLNAGLLATLVWPRHKENTPAETVAPLADSPAEERAIEVKPPVVVTPSKGFHWNQVESSDFQQYMSNLRGIGCPEETIRDLVIAEINKLYAPKFAALMAQANNYDYWKPASKKARQGLTKELEGLRAEKRALLKTLLGMDSDPHEQWANITVDQLIDQGRFASLSAEKQKQVRDILAKYELSQDIDPKKMREKRREELAQVLSPEELYAFDLRDSNAADSVRSRFGDADLSEAEYKKLFDLRKAYEEAVGASADYSDPEKMRKRSEARKLLDDAYKSALGEQRMEEIARQTDPGWRSLTQVGQQFNLDQQTLDRAYAMQQAAAQQMAQLFADQNLPREDRRKAADAINKELQENMATVLGTGPAQELQKAGSRMTFSMGGDAFTISTMPRGPVVPPAGGTITIDRPVIR